MGGVVTEIDHRHMGSALKVNLEVNLEALHQQTKPNRCKIDLPS